MRDDYCMQSQQSAQSAWKNGFFGAGPFVCLGNRSQPGPRHPLSIKVSGCSESLAHQIN